jgi:transcriptional regulator with XRE-family HTH domain
MSKEQGNATNAAPSQALAVAAIKGRPLHRLALVRRLQGVSRRTMARRLNIEVQQLRREEDATADLPLSVLYAWQKVLDVPIAELLVEASDSLSSPVLERSQLVRLMKTVLTVRAYARQKSIQRMAQTMANQLIEIMPELANVSAWQTVDKRRKPSELGWPPIGVWPTRHSSITGTSVLS